MAENKVRIIVEAVDKASAELKKINKEIDGIGNSSENSLDDLKRQFEEAQKPTESYTQALEDLRETSVHTNAGIEGLAVGAGAAALAIGFVFTQLNDVVKLSKDRPELFTAEELRAVDEYSSSLESIKESLTKIKIEAATSVMPWIAEDLRGLSDLGTGWKLIAELDFAGWRKWRDDIKSGGGISAELEKAAEAASSFDRAIQNQTGTVIKLRPELASAADELKRMSSLYSTLLGNMKSIASQDEAFAKSSEDIADRRKDLNKALQHEQLVLSQLYQSKGTSLAQLDSQRIKIIQLQDQINGLAEDERKLAENHQKASKQRVADLALQRLSVDGLTKDEYEYAQEMLRGLGLITSAQRDQAIAESQLADEYVNNFQTAGGKVDDMTKQLEDLTRRSPYMVDIIVNTWGDIPVFGQQATPIKTANFGGRPQRRQMGGPVFAGVPYLVGERGPEMFLPAQNGQIIPADKTAGMVTININNPKVRSNNDLDYLAQEVARRVTR